jgi:hypothetical protein
MGNSSWKSDRVAGRRVRAKAGQVTGIAVVVDELEWRALAEGNALFEAEDYEAYLTEIERRMTVAARAGRQVMVGPLMPDHFETRTDAAGLARDSPKALKEYERFVADLGPLTRPWLGEPISRILEQIRAHVRAETLQTHAMPALAAAASMHSEPDLAAQRAMSRAAHVFMALIEDGGDGRHELRITVHAEEGKLDYTLLYTRCAKVIAFPDDGGEHMVVVLLSIANLAERPGTVLLRSRPQTAFFPGRRKPKARPTSTDSRRRDSAAGGDDWEHHESTLRGWRLSGDLPQPMSEGQLFSFVCTGPGGDPVPPEPGTRFRAGFPLDPGRFRCCD